MKSALQLSLLKYKVQFRSEWRKKNYLLLFSLLFLVFSCEDVIEENIQTNIKGQFIDIKNNEPIQNLKVRIAEYNYMFRGAFVPQEIDFIGYVDSTLTNINGEYILDFTTSGKGDAYYLDFNGLDDKYYVGDLGSNVWGPYYREKKIDKLGGHQEMVFDCRFYYYMKTRIIIKDNPFPPLNILIKDVRNDVLYAAASVHGVNNDTILYIPVVKNSTNLLRFNYFDIEKQQVFSLPDITLNLTIENDTIDGGIYELSALEFN